VINIIDSVLTPPLGLTATAIEAEFTGTIAIVAGTDPDPRLFALDETSDWTMYIFHHDITLIFMEIRLILSIALPQTPLSFSIST
jgi:hypothetical protein